MRRHREGAASRARAFHRAVRVGAAATSCAAALLAGDSHAQSAPIENIVVTANRREEALQSIPSTVQVLTGASLDRQGAQNFQDYLAEIPSVGFRDAGQGSRQISMRGISNPGGSIYGVAASSSAVGIYLDDIPIQGTSRAPDLGIYDLQRVEVLKGPQGTLYGEGAMGGAIKLVLNQPDASSFSSKAEFRLADTDGGSISYRIRAAVNAPVLEDRAAIRAVASYGKQGGYIDNVANGKNDYNDTEQYSGRVLGTVDVSDRLRVQLTAMYDRQHIYGSNRQQEGLRAYQARDLVGEQSDDRFAILGATLRYDARWFDIVSSTSFYDRRWVYNEFYGDFSALFAQYTGLLAGAPFAGGNPERMSFRVDQHQRAISNETRLVSKPGDALSWVAGIFYRNRHQTSIGDIYVGDAATSWDPFLRSRGFPATPGTDIGGRRSSESFEQIALYGEATYEILPRLKATVGIRWFTEALGLVDDEYFVPPLATVFNSNTTINTRTYGRTPKFNLSYQLSDTALVYVQAAQGFRSGGPNLNHALDARVPAQFQSDTLWSYEAGLKTSWLDRRLTANLSAYYQDWTGLQVLSILDGTFGYTANAGKASVRGVEAELAWIIDPAWRVGANLGFNDATIDQPVAGAAAGTVTPNAPRLTYAAFVEYLRPAWNEVNFSARADVRHVGRQATVLVAPPDNGLFINGYTTENVRVGLEGTSWDASLFVENLSNQVVQYNRTNNLLFQRISVGRPRTVGVQLQLKF